MEIKSIQDILQFCANKSIDTTEVFPPNSIQMPMFSDRESYDNVLQRIDSAEHQLLYVYSEYDGRIYQISANEGLSEYSNRYLIVKCMHLLYNADLDNNPTKDYRLMLYKKANMSDDKVADDTISEPTLIERLISKLP